MSAAHLKPVQQLSLTAGRTPFETRLQDLEDSVVAVQIVLDRIEKKIDVRLAGRGVAVDAQTSARSLSQIESALKRLPSRFLVLAAVCGNFLLGVGAVAAAVSILTAML